MYTRGKNEKKKKHKISGWVLMIKAESRSPQLYIKEMMRKRERDTARTILQKLQGM